ncbi:MAG: hypothetical protein ACKVOE_00410 [Rickettsiales bacterium]
MRFSSVFCCVAVLALAGCTYFIPDNPSAPRYSSLQGERHVPALNQQQLQNNPQESQNAAPLPEVAVAEVPPPALVQVTDNPAFPPVDATTRARASEVIAARQVPLENGSVQVAGNAPAFTDVPPRPVMNGDASAETQLNQVRAQLERDRAAAQAAHGQLATDAAAEPSLLRDPGSTPVPVAPAVPLAPLGNAPSQPTYSPPPTAAPAPVSNNFIAPVPLMPAPPPPSVGSGYAYAPGNPANAAPPIQVAPAPSVAGLEPIILRPPVGSPVAAAAAPRRFEAPPEYAPSGAMPAGGGFNPNASGDPSRSYASGAGFLPSSRYTR